MRHLHLFKYMLCTAAVSVLCFGMTAFAAPDGKSSDGFPYAVELDTESCDRLTYAGHKGNGVRYTEGEAITPQTQFKLNLVNGDAAASTANLEIEISVIYENSDNSGSRKETVKKFNYGDLDTDLDTYYSFFSENTMENLAERDKLYSSPMRSVEMELSYNMRGTKTEKNYYHVCTDEELDSYIDSAPESVEETEAAFLEL